MHSFPTACFMSKCRGSWSFGALRLASIYKPRQPIYSFTMKRAATSTAPGGSRAKKARAAEVPAYHLTPSVKADDGSIIWPAPEQKLGLARDFIREWRVQPPSIHRHILQLTEIVLQCICRETRPHRARQRRRWPDLWGHPAPHTHPPQPRPSQRVDISPRERLYSSYRCIPRRHGCVRPFIHFRPGSRVTEITTTCPKPRASVHRHRPPSCPRE